MRATIKLGGSVVSFEKDGFPKTIDEIKKRGPEFINTAAIDGFAVQLKEELDKGDLEVVLANGVGPFGHYLVKQNVDQETVHESVSYLNSVIVERLRTQGIQAVSVSPYDYCYETGVKSVDALWGPISAALKEGKVPVSHGDCAPSNAKGLTGYNVISADDVVVTAAEWWPANAALMFMDVSGVYTGHPRDPASKFVASIPADEEAKTAEEFVARMQELGIIFGSGKQSDVTGGIAAKVWKLYNLTARTGINSRLAGLTTDPLCDVLSATSGTMIYKREEANG